MIMEVDGLRVRSFFFRERDTSRINSSIRYHRLGGRCVGHPNRFSLSTGMSLSGDFKSLLALVSSSRKNAFGRPFFLFFQRNDDLLRCRYTTRNNKTITTKGVAGVGDGCKWRRDCISIKRRYTQCVGPLGNMAHVSAHYTYTI